MAKWSISEYPKRMYTAHVLLRGCGLVVVQNALYTRSTALCDIGFPLYSGPKACQPHQERRYKTLISSRHGSKQALSKHD
ncbi:hypothetical protein EON65_46465 [archaeon]|nr:MAG: hypothetical protein EON65_46465 [archaeon]